jgi:hypothetical protein
MTETNKSHLGVNLMPSAILSSENSEFLSLDEKESSHMLANNNDGSTLNQKKRMPKKKKNMELTVTTSS